jgi:formate dehydrogenase iron-sulfur subunit
VDRRGFLKTCGVAAGAGLVAQAAGARSVRDGDEMSGVLIDLTRCMGCRSCEAACAEANGLPEPDWSDDMAYTAERKPTDSQWAAVSRYETSKGEVFVKRQCMHCVEPACAAACLTKALQKTAEGPVVWDADKCMGCRYCMLSCPFDVPKFEYHSANPKIQKCQLCHGRLAAGQVPACVEACPNEALTFGKRSELLEIARERIYQNPGDYVSHIYGETEAGGTGTLYISPVPFEELAFRTDLDHASYPELTTDFLTAVPLVLVAWPAFLSSLRQATGRDAAHAAGEAQ